LILVTEKILDLNISITKDKFKRRKEGVGLDAEVDGGREVIGTSVSNTPRY